MVVGINSFDAKIIENVISFMTQLRLNEKF